VFRPNFRGSAGFGLKFQSLGEKQWGLAMQDDITDGVRWLIDSGVADPDRICIFGASYGGYASLIGLTKTPELFTCGAALGGISDLAEQLATTSAILDQEAFIRRLGRPGVDPSRIEETSPLTHVSRIRAPVFLAHGTEDRIVRSTQSEEMARALAAAGKPHHLFMIEGQPNALVGEAERIRFYRNLEAFFHRHLGGAGAARQAVSATKP